MKAQTVNKHALLPAPYSERKCRDVECSIQLALNDHLRRNAHSKIRNSSSCSVVWTRRLGPRWIAAGRRPKMVEVFWLRSTVLRARAST
jgi:hypothetical protein